MAEIALLAALIPKLVSLLDGEVQLHKTVRKDLESIMRELECIKEFLMAVDNMDEDILRNDAWVTHVREAAFEAEDILDEFTLHIAGDQLDAGSSSTSNSCCVISTVKNVKAQHDIAIKMQDIKSKFVAIWEERQRYRTESSKPVIPPARNRWLNSIRDVHNLSKDELVGTKLHERNLTNKLLFATGCSTRINVVSVSGMGGVGKTSLVKKVYDSAEVKNHFTGQVWITVSRNFGPDEILKELIRSLTEEMTRPEPEELGKIESRQKFLKFLKNWTSIELQQRARALLHSKRFLIVLDDVWSPSDWNSIFLHVLSGIVWEGLVLITTRNADTALIACGGREKMYELKPLSFDESQDLFYTKIFGSPSSCPDHLKEVSKNILKKCEGLPLAIVAIAGVLISKDATAQSDVWGRINLGLQEEFKNTQRILLISFNDLPFELKPCFLYLIIFPEDHLIQKSRLIKLWIVEGFVERKDFLTFEDAAESYLDELISRSLIQVVGRTGDGRVETCRIHDLVREMITEKAMHQRFAALARVSDDLRSVKTRRLSLYSDLALVQKHSLGLSQLRAFFMFHGKRPAELSIPILFFNQFNFKLLTVLDLQGTQLDKFPSTILKLKNLKYLNLSHTDIKEVPSSIGKLRRLETLDLSSSLVCELPEEILKLQRLCDVLAYRVQDEIIYGIKVPAGIHCLRSLENLFFLDAEQYRHGGIAAKDLAHLRRLGITNLSNLNAKAICSPIKDLKYLRVLSMSCSESGEQTMDLQELVSPSQSLRRLYLTGKIECLPQWLATLENLVTLYLKSSKLQVDPTDIIGQLPNLIHLELFEAHTRAEMCFRAGHFQKLKVMGLSDFTCLEKVTFEYQTMPNLERLSMENNKLMKIFPSGIENLSKLEELNFFRITPELATAVGGSIGQVGTEYENFEHVREANWACKVDNRKILSRPSPLNQSKTNIWKKGLNNSIIGVTMIRMWVESGGYIGQSNPMCIIM